MFCVQTGSFQAKALKARLAATANVREWFFICLYLEEEEEFKMLMGAGWDVSRL